MARARPASHAGSRPTPSSVRSTTVPPPAARKAAELLDDDRLVAAELPVVPAVRDVPERDRGVLVGQDPAELRRVDRPEDGLDATAGRPRSRGGAARAGPIRTGCAGAGGDRLGRRGCAGGEQRLDQGEDPPLVRRSGGRRRLPRWPGSASRRAARRAPAAIDGTSSHAGSSPRITPSWRRSTVAVTVSRRRRRSISRIAGSVSTSAQAWRSRKPRAALRTARPRDCRTRSRRRPRCRSR